MSELERKLLEVYIDLHSRVTKLLDSPIGDLTYALKGMDSRVTPVEEVRHVGRISGKLDALKILLHSLENDIATEVIILEKKIRSRNPSE
jgi:hypothetical protein